MHSVLMSVGSESSLFGGLLFLYPIHHQIYPTKLKLAFDTIPIKSSESVYEWEPAKTPMFIWVFFFATPRMSNLRPNTFPYFEYTANF